MTEAERLDRLEDVLAQFLKPVKGIPFSVVIRSMSEKQVFPVNLKDPQDKALVDILVRCAHQVGADVRAKPILRPRPNEVGNDIETYIMTALKTVGLAAMRPLSAGGRGQGVGYPDILIEDAGGRPTYVEAKIYSAKTAESSMRSFYLSPSENFKVSKDARHILMAFEMVMERVPASDLYSFTAVAFKLVDLHDLEIDVKYEFQSDNRRLYAKSAMLAAGPV